MSSPEPEFQQVSGLWTAPVVESTSDQTVHLHVSIGVGSIGELADEEVDAVLVAGGTQLEELERPGTTESIDYLQLKSITAIAHFAFANPGDLALEYVNVRVRDETVGFTLGPAADLPVA